MRPTRVGLGLAICLWCACNTAVTTNDVCAGVTCSGNGLCVADADKPRCVCASGFAASGLECVPVDPCAPNPCAEAHRSVCTAQGHVATCSCDPGYWDKGSCVLAVSCSPDPCTKPHQTACTLNGQTVICGCDQGYHDDGAGGCALADPCTPNPCTDTHRTTCRTVGAAAVCSCDPGYWDEGQCVPAASCTPDPCSKPHQSVCSLSGQGVVCGCDTGFHDDGKGGCAAIDPCMPSPCTEAHRTVCHSSGTAAICICDPGFREDGLGGCVDACNPNPCKAANQSVCAPLPGSYQCNCDPGYIADASGACEYDPPANCGDAHQTGDAYEPDECPTLARLVKVQLTENHTIDPQSDVDWVAFDAKDGHIYKVEADPTGFSVELSIRDSTGIQVLATASTYSGSQAIVWVSPGAQRTLVRVRSTDNMGNYTLRISDAGSDDYGNDYSKATTVQVGAHVTGKIDYPNDEDWFSFDADTGHIYQISSGSWETRVQLWDAIGAATPLTSNPLASSDNGKLTWTCAVGGTFYFRITDYYGNAVSYSFDLTDLGMDDYGDTAAKATPVSLGTQIEGAIQFTQDQDWFSFYATQDHIYKASVQAAADVDVAMFDTSASYPITNSGGQTVTIAAKAASTGRYYVRIQSYYGYNPTYLLQIDDAGLDDHGDSRQTATTMTVGVPISGSIDYPNDQDYFSFATVLGHVYQVSVDPQNVSFSVYTPDGSQLWGYNGTFVFGATDAGPYYVDVQFYSATSTTYQLTVREIGVDDYGNSAVTASPIAAGTTLAGVLDYPNDVDWFSFAGAANHVYQVKLVPSGFSPYSQLYGTDGVKVLATFGTDYQFHLASAGTYFVSVAGNYSGNQQSAYTFLLTDLGEDDHGNQPEDGTALSLGSTTSGSLQYSGDVDWFSIPCAAGHIYRATVTPLGFVAEAKVEDPDRHQLATGFSFQPLALLFSASTNSAYNLAVFGHYDGTVGSYTVLVEDIGLDDFANTEAQAWPLTVGSAAISGAIQFPSDEDWFSYPTSLGRIYRTTVIPAGVTLQVQTVNFDGKSWLTDQTSDKPMTTELGADGTGSYHVRVLGNLGAYTIQVEDVGADDFGDTLALASPITPGDPPTSGAIQFLGDRDVFTFSTSGKQLMHFTLGGTLSTWMAIAKSNGTTIGRETGPATMDFTLPAAGTYYLIIEANNAGELGSYTIQVTP